MARKRRMRKQGLLRPKATPAKEAPKKAVPKKAEPVAPAPAPKAVKLTPVAPPATKPEN